MCIRGMSTFPSVSKRLRLGALMSSNLSLALNSQMSTDCDTLNPLPYRHRFKKALVPPIESHLLVCSCELSRRLRMMEPYTAVVRGRGRPWGSLSRRNLLSTNTLRQGKSGADQNVRNPIG